MHICGAPLLVPAFSRARCKPSRLTDPSTRTGNLLSVIANNEGVQELSTAFHKQIRNIQYQRTSTK